MFQVHRVPARCLIDQLNQEKHDTSISARTGSDSLRNSPRGLHTSLEGGLNDVDLLSICKVTPVDQIVEKVVGKIAAQGMIFRTCYTSIQKLTISVLIILAITYRQKILVVIRSVSQLLTDHIPENKQLICWFQCVLGSFLGFYPVFIHLPPHSL